MSVWTVGGSPISIRAPVQWKEKTPVAITITQRLSLPSALLNIVKTTQPLPSTCHAHACTHTPFQQTNELLQNMSSYLLLCWSLLLTVGEEKRAGGCCWMEERRECEGVRERGRRRRRRIERARERQTDRERWVGHVSVSRMVQCTSLCEQ